jgi:hypothetical protein
MASMSERTVWQARRATRGNLDRLLCGRMVGGRYDCPEEVARTNPAVPGVVLLPPGLMEKSPSEYGWSPYSLAALARGDRPRDRRSYGDSVRLSAEEAAVLPGQRPRGTKLYRSVLPPVTVPCPRHHANRIDPDSANAVASR